MGRRKSYPGHIERRGKAYRLVLQVQGRRSTYTLKGVTRAEAERFARSQYAQLEAEAERVGAGLPASVPFSRLLVEYENGVLPGRAPGTVRSYLNSLKPIRTYFVEKLGDPPVERIRRSQVKQFLQWRRLHGPDGEPAAKPLSKRTLQKDRAILHLLFRLACELEYVDANPVSSIRPEKPDPRNPVILSADEYESLLEACRFDPMLHTYCLVLGEAGLRCESEALWIQWQDVDQKSGFLWVDSGRGGHRTKSGRGRWVPMTQRLRRALADHGSQFRMATYGGTRSPWVFHHTRTVRRAVAGERIASLRDPLGRAAQAAQVPKRWVPHDLRHRRATSWLADGKSPALVKEALGHASLSTTMGYMHLVRENLLGLVEPGPSLNELHGLVETERRVVEASAR